MLQTFLLYYPYIQALGNSREHLFGFWFWNSKISGEVSSMEMFVKTFLINKTYKIYFFRWFAVAWKWCVKQSELIKNTFIILCLNSFKLEYNAIVFKMVILYYPVIFCLVSSNTYEKWGDIVTGREPDGCSYIILCLHSLKLKYNVILFKMAILYLLSSSIWSCIM